MDEQIKSNKHDVAKQISSSPLASAIRDASDAKILEKIKQRFQKERQWKTTFGNIKPIISAEGNGIRFVAVGNTTGYRLKSSETFPDFLLWYIWEVFDSDWIKQQKFQAPENLHTLIKWFRSFRKSYRSQSEGKTDIIIDYHFNGAAKALVSLAYDLFTVENNLYLPPILLHRLRNAQQFQGARYELFCICALLRGGFSVEFEDETDGTTSHPELIATHLSTGTKIAVEAKSKHRKGILGMPGERVPDEKLRFGNVRKLLNDAVSKNVNIPLIIFFDVNLPPDSAKKFLASSSDDKTLKVIKSLRQTDDLNDLFNFVLFTNHPHHYGRDDETDPHKIYSGRIPANPKHPIVHMSVIEDIVSGATKYGHIPQEFNSEP